MVTLGESDGNNLESSRKETILHTQNSVFLLRKLVNKLSITMKICTSTQLRHIDVNILSFK